jgi:type IV secretion system protein VirB4
MKIAPFTRNIAERLVEGSLEFDWSKGRIHFDGERVGAIISIHQWGDDSSSNMFRDLARLEGDITYLHLIQGIPKLKALSILKTKESEEGGLFTSITDKAAEEYDVAKQVIQNEDGSFHGYQFSMIIVADKEKELLALIKKTKGIFTGYGATGVVEKQAVEHIWRCQFPAHESFVRKSDIFSHNLSSILTFDKDPVGLSKCDWGEGPLRNFKTINGSSFPLNVHESEQDKALGHNLIIAPSNSGKTTLIQHLIAGALRHPELRVFVFDRYNGTNIFTDSCGGEYIDVESDKGVTLNPFIEKDTLSNRMRLRRLLKMMSGNCDVSASELNDAVDLMLGIDPEFRIFSKVYKSLLRSNSEFSTNLKEWATGAYSHWFNGERDGKAYDALDLSASRLVGFEMTQILGGENGEDAKSSSGPLIYYIMERILSVIREKGCPSWLVIDETKPMLETPFFKKYISILLLEARKLGGVVTLCFQDVKHLKESGIGSVILGQCPTVFLFPNTKANRKDYEDFNLTDSEWEYIQKKNKIASKYKRTVLMKKENESVILNIDLSVLGKYFKLYKSDNDLVKEVNQLKKKEGDQWVDTYLEA